MGLRMLASDWPRCAWYVLFPPLAVVLVSQAFGRGNALGIEWLPLTLAAAGLNLLFKGATTAFYLRRYPEQDTSRKVDEIPVAPYPYDDL